MIGHSLKFAMMPSGACHEAQSKPSIPMSACVFSLLTTQWEKKGILIKDSVSCVPVSARRSCTNGLSINPEPRLFQGQNGFCFICRPQRGTLHSNDPQTQWECLSKALLGTHWGFVHTAKRRCRIVLHSPTDWSVILRKLPPCSRNLRGISVLFLPLLFKSIHLLLNAASASKKYVGY